MRVLSPRPVGSLVVVACALGLLVVSRVSGREGPPASAGSSSAFVGAARCTVCHAPIHKKWKGGRHSKMLQPAGPASVLGDFDRGSVSLRGKRYRLRVEGERYFIGEGGSESRVDYTLGNRRVQHYLTTRPDGRIVVLPPTWDVQRRQWFHNMEIVNRDETSATAVQIWNQGCYGCHVSQQEKSYDPATDTYATRWVDFGTSCERCHGPGRRHVERYDRPASDEEDPWSWILRPTRLSHVAGTMICAQCHSLRDVTAAGFTAGQDYYDYFFPVLEHAQRAGKDPAYWPDGRPRRFSNDAMGLWQSQCFLKGRASCTTCHHDPHEPDVDRDPRLAPSNNALCTRCHEEVGRRLADHTRHRPESPGSSCIECHMPKTVVSLKSRMRDHTISVPAPENTVRFGIPNACNECHRDKDAAWSAARLAEWYPGGRRRGLVTRAETFTRARAGDPAALDGLIALASDETLPALVRANALGYLRTYRDRRVLTVLLSALEAEHPLLRAVAALDLGEPGTEAAAVAPALAEALRDPKRIVRMSAALSLINLGITRLPGEDGRRLEAAKRDIVARAGLHADDAPTQLDLGKLYLRDLDLEKAAAAIEVSLRLDPRQSGARYFLALARMGQQKSAEARELLRQIPAADPFSQPARRLLQRLEARP